MTASVTNISIKRDSNRLETLDKQHNRYLGQWLSIMLSKSGKKAATDMGKLNLKIDAVQLEIEEIQKRVYS